MELGNIDILPVVFQVGYPVTLMLLFRKLDQFPGRVRLTLDFVFQLKVPLLDGPLVLLQPLVLLFLILSLFLVKLEDVRVLLIHIL